MEAFYKANHNTIYCLDFRKNDLPDESIQCVVTSPPYWGLRKYSGEQELIWGDNHCRHQWDSYEATLLHENRQGLGSFDVTPKIGIHGKKVGQASFCSLCGAWKGAYGLEPTPEMYIEHTIEILREIRRVLRKDGVCFLNLGDSYAGNWGSMSHDLKGKAKRAGTNERPPQSFVGKKRGEQNDKRGKELLDLKVRDFFSKNPCGECVGTLLNRSPDKYDYPSLALAVSGVLSNRSHKEQLIDHSDNLGSASRGDHTEGDTSGLCSFARFLDGVARGVQESTNFVSFGEFPQCPSAQSYWDCQSLNGIVLPSLLQTNDEICPFWLYSLSHGIQGLTESISNTLEIDGASAVRIKDKAFGSSSLPYSIIPQHQLKLKPKDLCLIPFRVAIAAQEDGWWVRSVIIWSKPNPMPESVTDRPTESHEYILMLTKSGKIQYWTHPRKRGSRTKPKPDYIWTHKRTRLTVDYPPVSDRILREFWTRSNLWRGHGYYWDADAVREQYTEPMNRWGGETLKRDTSKTAAYKEMQNIGYSSAFRVGRPMRPNPSGRNIRSVWEFPTQPYPEAHFAVFPEKLPELCIKAATPEVGCCSKCGAPWERVVERPDMRERPLRTVAKQDGQRIHSGFDGYPQSAGQQWQRWRDENPDKTTGWQPTCKCNADKVPSIVLDPMMGAGTTLWVAKKLDRRAVGYEISEEYCQLAVDRCQQQILL